MELALTPEVEQILERRMQEGRWKSPNDVMLTALHLLDEMDEVVAANREELEVKIQEGLDSAEQGELYTPEEVRAHLAEVRAKLKQ